LEWAEVDQQTIGDYDCTIDKCGFDLVVHCVGTDLYTISQGTVSAAHCPYCGHDHEWRYSDAEWVEDWIENK
jgi:hypothetical protein